MSFFPDPHDYPEPPVIDEHDELPPWLGAPRRIDGAVVVEAAARSRPVWNS